MTMRNDLCTVVFVLLAGLASLNCGARTQSSAVTPMMNQEVGPGPLRPIDASSQDFFAEHHVEITWGETSRSFRAVLQKRGATLELIMLGPMEQPVVRVFQDGDEVGMERLIQRRLPFEAEYILADVQKAFLPWVGAKSTQHEGGHLVHEGVFETLHWREVVRAEKVHERSFWREDLGEEVPLRVVYEYEESKETPSAVTLYNRWLSYTLRIQTLRWAPL